MSNFVPEIRPKPFQNPFNGKDDFVAEIRSKTSRQNAPLQIRDLGLSCEASDSDIQQMLSEKKFSREGLVHLLERSLVTLVEKLLTGSSICNIEGTLCISFSDNECPLIVNLQKRFPGISNSHHTDHLILDKQQPGNLLLEKRQTESLFLEKGQSKNLFLEERQTDSRLREKHQPAHLLLENCLNVKVKARDTAASHGLCNSPGILSSPGNGFERDPCHSLVEIDCGSTAPPESQDGIARYLSPCVPYNSRTSPVNGRLSCTSLDTNLIHATRGASSASSPNPDGEDNEIQLRYTEDDCPINRESDAESGYHSNEKEDSDIVSKTNKYSETSIDGYNDYFCSGFDGPSSRYASLESLVSDSLCKVEDFESYGSSAEGSDEMEEDGDEDYEHRLVIDENALNDLKIENMTDKTENYGLIGNCCSPSKSVTNVSNLSDVKPVQKLNEEERMSLESKDVESTNCLDIVNTKPNEEPHEISGLNLNHVPGMPHSHHIVPGHLRRKFLNKSSFSIQPSSTTALIQVPSEQGVHVYNHCCRTYTAKNNPKRHLRHHTGQRPYKCTSCPKSFFRRDDLKGHMIRHKYEKPFRCSRCQKGYTDRACIKSHMAKEHGSRLMHVCPQCGESFDCEEAFACHKGTHPELKQFACTTCSFIGTSNLMLLKHHLLHSHKLFSCKPCNAYFADPFHYTSHVRKHKKMASFTHYVCCFCDTILGTYEHLVRHENSHAQCKIHACSICTKQFRSKIRLRDHLMTHQQPAQIVTEHALPKTVDTEMSLWESEQKYSLYKDMNMQPKPIDFTRQRSDCLLQESSPLEVNMEDDECYGQLLDLSMKKSPSLTRTEDSCNISNQTQIGSYNTSARATGTSVNDGFRNDASSSDPAALSLECGLRRSGLAPHHTLKTALLDGSSLKLMLSDFTNVAGSPELANYRNRFSLSSDYKPTPFMDVTGSHAVVEPSFARRSRRAERAHHVRGVSTNAVTDKKLWSRTTCNQPRGKDLYFSPYSREKMADLAVKFIVARGSKLVGDKGRVNVKSAGEKEEKKVGDLRQQSAHVGKISGTSSMNTQGSCKNAILDLTGQAHQENDTVGSEYSNMETSLRCHIPTVVKSEPLKEHDANAGSPLDFRCRALKAYGDESRGSAVDNHDCDICREVFRTFLELEDHSVEVHKRYLCEHCKKGFTARPNRDRHVRYHTGERPYKCDLCDLAFFRGDDLKYHRTTRHPTAQPFVCPHCSASFTWGRDLEKHIRHSKCKV